MEPKGLYRGISNSMFGYYEVEVRFDANRVVLREAGSREAKTRTLNRSYLYQMTPEVVAEYLGTSGYDATGFYIHKKALQTGENLLFFFFPQQPGHPEGYDAIMMHFLDRPKIHPLEAPDAWLFSAERFTDSEFERYLREFEHQNDHVYHLPRLH